MSENFYSSSSRYEDDIDDIDGNDEFNIDDDISVDVVSEEDEFPSNYSAITDEDLIPSTYLSDPIKLPSQPKISPSRTLYINGKTLDLKYVERSKKEHFYNRNTMLEFKTVLGHLTSLIKNGMTPPLPDSIFHDNYEECNEETIALVLLLKCKTNLFTKKGKMLYSVDNYPIEDNISLFKKSYIFLKDFSFIYKSKIINLLFPSIVKNLEEINIREEEIKECRGF